jgi:iron complex transport system substrate-binding protein
MRVLLTLLIMQLVTATWAYAAPITIESCGRPLNIQNPPKRAVAIDINTTEIMLKLGLASRMVGVAGIEGKHKIQEDLRPAFAGLTQISDQYPSLEALLSVNPDFVFGGWKYGFSQASGVTPQRLQKFGIDSYALEESCARIKPRQTIAFHNVFADVRRIAQVFGRSTKAEQLIRQWQQQLQAIPQRRQAAVRLPRVFVYDSGLKSPFTAAGLAMPNAIIDAAGGQNIFHDLPKSWTNVNWEEVIARRPEFILIVDYGELSGTAKWDFLKKKLGDYQLPAITQERYLVLPYAALTPGIRNVAAAVKLSRALQSI